MYVEEDELDAAITSVPGMETYLRRRDLSSFCRAYDLKNPIIQLVLNQVQNFPKSQRHILNTFDELEVITSITYELYVQICKTLDLSI